MKKITVRNLTVTAMLAAAAGVLMMLHFPIPGMPDFLAFDVADLPPLLASFALGPVYGVVVCFLKNAIHMLLHTSHTMAVGELSNFILSSVFVFTAGMIYRKHKTRKGAIVGALCGAVTMAVTCVFTNYFIVYPIYGFAMNWSWEFILGLYQKILPWVDNMWQALIIFNLPFTFVKGLCSTVIAFIIYKPLSPVLKGKMQ